MFSNAGPSAVDVEREMTVERQADGSIEFTIAELRRQLGAVLVRLQDAALNVGTSPTGSVPFAIAEKVAEASSKLFSIERASAAPSIRVERLDGALRALRDALALLQSAQTDGEDLSACAEPMARSLAVLYAMAKAEERASGVQSSFAKTARSDVPEPRARTKPIHGALALLMSDGQDRSDPPPPRVEAINVSPVEPPPPEKLSSAAPVGSPLTDKLSSDASSEPPAKSEEPIQTVLSSQQSPTPPTIASATEELAPDTEPHASSALARRSRRACERASIEVDVGFATDTTFYAGLSMDLSTGGLFVATYKVHPIGTPVALSFVLPDGHTVSTEGTVRWVREHVEGAEPPGMGIEFLGLSAADMTAVKAFCRARTPMYYDTDF
jgi:uncharacterized protein (TIGR02266 family)